MKNGALWDEGFAKLQDCEMENINGGEVLLLPLGLTWKDVINFGIANYQEIKKGLVDGWSYPDKQ